MAEIKSTLEKVMERVAAMGNASPKEVEDEELLKSGMKLAAQYLQNKLPEPEKTLYDTLSGYPGNEQLQIRKGVIQVLLRNIVLPREENLERSERAIQGLIDVGGGSGDLVAVMQDMQQILGQYIQHRTQMQEQLETAFKQQLEQAAAQQQGFSGSVEPTLHPKFAEEWQRIKEELNDQYGRALDQHKALLSERMT